MIKKKLIARINSQVDCDLTFEDLKKAAMERNIYIKKYNYKPLLISICSFLLVFTSVILGIGYSNKRENHSSKIILPKTIEFFGVFYSDSDRTITNSEYILKIVGYIINKKDEKKFLEEYPDTEYYSTKYIKSNIFSDRVPVYSITNYDMNKYLAVAYDSGISFVYTADNT